MKTKYCFLSMAILLIVVGVYETHGKPSDTIVTPTGTTDENISGTFVIGGYSTVVGGVTRYVKKSNRYCSISPINDGIYKFKGNLKITGAQRIKRKLKQDTGKVSYDVYGSVTSRFVSYDEINDITTIEVYSKDPFIISFRKADNSVFKKGEFKVISYTPPDNIDTYNVNVQPINPCEESSLIVKYHEPTMVVADDGTIIIAAYCEDTDGNRSVLNTVSHDGGMTWITNWSSGILSMAWDRFNHRLCGVKSGTSYVSYDYGMSWKKIGTYDNTYVTDDMRNYCLTYRIEEKQNYEKNRSTQRYSYIAYTVNTGNSGIQLENGVICMPMLIRLKKSLAAKDEKNRWIVDTDGYCVPVNKDANDLERVVAYVIYSKDYGVTWEHSATTPSDIICEETCITEVLPNQVCMNSRGGTERRWSKDPSIRRIFIQHTPVKDRDSFAIDQWDADWGTRDSNTIEDALVNADIEKIKRFSFTGSGKEEVSFWLFCNIYNPGSFVRKGLMLRLSTDCRNWENVGYLTPSNKAIGGYCELGSDNSHIYMVYEGNRDSEPLSFVCLDKYFLNEILSSYENNQMHSMKYE